MGSGTWASLLFSKLDLSLLVALGGKVQNWALHLVQPRPRIFPPTFWLGPVVLPCREGRCLNLRTLSKSILFAAHVRRGGTAGAGHSPKPSQNQPHTRSLPLQRLALHWESHIDTAVYKRQLHLLCFEFSALHICGEYETPPTDNFCPFYRFYYVCVGLGL